MASAHHEIRIEAPAEEVFDFLLDGTHNASWQRAVVTTAAAREPIAVGTTFRQRMRHPLGFTVPADYEVTVLERPTALALRGTAGGPIRPTQRYELTDRGDGSTLVRSTVEYRPSGVLRVTLPVLALLHPLFAWEASWIERLPGAMGRPGAAAP